MWTTKNVTCHIALSLLLLLSSCSEQELVKTSSSPPIAFEENDDSSDSITNIEVGTDEIFIAFSDLELTTSHEPISFNFLDGVADLTNGSEMLAYIVSSFNAKHLKKDQKQTAIWQDLNGIKNAFTISTSPVGIINKISYAIFFEEQDQQLLINAYFEEIKQALLNQLDEPNIPASPTSEKTLRWWYNENILLQLLSGNKEINLKISTTE